MGQECLKFCQFYVVYSSDRHKPIFYCLAPVLPYNPPPSGQSARRLLWPRAEAIYHNSTLVPRWIKGKWVGWRALKYKTPKTTPEARNASQKGKTGQYFSQKNFCLKLWLDIFWKCSPQQMLNCLNVCQSINIEFIAVMSTCIALIWLNSTSLFTQLYNVLQVSCEGCLHCERLSRWQDMEDGIAPRCQNNNYNQERME